MISILNTIEEALNVKIDKKNYVINPGVNEFNDLSKERAEQLVKNVHFLKIVNNKNVDKLEQELVNKKNMFIAENGEDNLSLWDEIKNFFKYAFIR